MSPQKTKSAFTMRPCLRLRQFPANTWGRAQAQAHGKSAFSCSLFGSPQPARSFLSGRIQSITVPRPMSSASYRSTPAMIAAAHSAPTSRPQPTPSVNRNVTFFLLTKYSSVETPMMVKAHVSITFPFVLSANRNDDLHRLPLVLVLIRNPMRLTVRADDIVRRAFHSHVFAQDSRGSIRVVAVPTALGDIFR